MISNTAVSIIIPVFNGIRHIKEQMDAIECQSCKQPWEVLYIDNGSTDGSKEYISQRIQDHKHLNIRLYEASEHKGQVYARNQGAKFAQGNILVFTDQDDLPATDWLSEISEAIQHANAVGGYVEVTGAGKPPTPNSTSPAAALPVLFGNLPIALGTNFAIRRDVLASVGGWIDIGVYAGEDVDLCMRLKLNNIELCYAPRARVTWRSRTDKTGIFRQGQTYGRSDVLIYSKYRDKLAWKLSTKTVLRAIKQALLNTYGYLFENDLGALHSLGWFYGRIQQSIKSRCIYI